MEEMMAEWRSHPCTKHFMQQLKEYIDDHKDITNIRVEEGDISQIGENVLAQVNYIQGLLEALAMMEGGA